MICPSRGQMKQEIMKLQTTKITKFIEQKRYRIKHVRRIPKRDIKISTKNKPRVWKTS
jgi:hypothetical protein